MPYRPPSGNGWPTAAGSDRHNGDAVGRRVMQPGGQQAGKTLAQLPAQADGAWPGGPSPENLP